MIKAVSPYFKEKESWQEVLYRGSSPEDVLEEFVKKMDWVRNSALKWLDENGRVEMKPLTATQQEEYDNAKTCWICGKGIVIYCLLIIKKNLSVF